MALKQISHPRSTEVLLHYTNDREVRVRQLARSTEMTDGRRAHAEAGSGD
jgi:hypothetical protein